MASHDTLHLDRAPKQIPKFLPLIVTTPHFLDGNGGAMMKLDLRGVEKFEIALFSLSLATMPINTTSDQSLDRNNVRQCEDEISEAYEGSPCALNHNGSRNLYAVLQVLFTHVVASPLSLDLPGGSKIRVIRKTSLSSPSSLNRSGSYESMMDLTSLTSSPHCLDSSSGNPRFDVVASLARSPSCLDSSSG